MQPGRVSPSIQSTTHTTPTSIQPSQTTRSGETPPEQIHEIPAQAPFTRPEGGGPRTVTQVHRGPEAVLAAFARAITNAVSSIKELISRTLSDVRTTETPEFRNAVESNIKGLRDTYGTAAARAAEHVFRDAYFASLDKAPGNTSKALEFAKEATDIFVGTRKSADPHQMSSSEANLCARAHAEAYIQAHRAGMATKMMSPEDVSAFAKHAAEQFNSAFGAAREFLDVEEALAATTKAADFFTHAVYNAVIFGMTPKEALENANMLALHFNSTLEMAVEARMGIEDAVASAVSAARTAANRFYSVFNSAVRFPDSTFPGLTRGTREYFAAWRAAVDENVNLKAVYATAHTAAKAGISAFQKAYRSCIDARMTPRNALVVAVSAENVVPIAYENVRGTIVSAAHKDPWRIRPLEGYKAADQTFIQETDSSAQKAADASITVFLEAFTDFRKMAHTNNTSAATLASNTIDVFNGICREAMEANKTAEEAIAIATDAAGLYRTSYSISIYDQHLPPQEAEERAYDEAWRTANTRLPRHTFVRPT